MSIRKLFAVISGVGIGVGVCASASARDSSYQDWPFADAINPASPAVATNTAGAAIVVITVGYAGSGWLADLSGLGTQTGLWDLGAQNPGDPAHDTRGTFALTVPNPGPTGGDSSTDLGMRVTQFVDGTFYTGDLVFSLSGAQYSGRTIIESLPGPLGGAWVADEYHWRLAPSPALISLTVTGAVSGTLLDRLVVTTANPAEETAPVQITSVRQQGQALSLTWAGGLAPYQVYSTTNLPSAGPWEPVGSLVSGTSAEIPMSGPVGFVRVRGSQ